MLTDLRMTVLDNHASSVLCLDATKAGDLAGTKGYVKYDNTPQGCGSAEFTVGLSYAQIVAKDGYYRARNIVEISVADDTMTQTINTTVSSFTTAEQAAGVVARVYVSNTTAWDPTQNLDAQQIYLWDGSTLTMRIPVYGVGVDAASGNAPYIACLAPLAGGGNPTTISPSYTTGTYVGRRRYAGRIIKRARADSKLPMSIVSCVGLINTLAEGNGSFPMSQSLDVGSAVYTAVSAFTSRWPELVIASGNFPTTGSNFQGTASSVGVDQMISQMLAQISSGDLWNVRIGHDRTVKLVKLYTSASNTYTYTVTLPKNVPAFEPVGFQSSDEDASQLFNSIEVIGDTDPTTKQPVRAIIQDSTSIGLYGQIDARPQNVTGLKTVAQCQSVGRAMLNQQAVATSSQQFRVYIRNDGTSYSNMPLGLPNGDIIRGYESVTISRLNDTGISPNLVPDSVFAYTSGLTSLWTLGGMTTGTEGYVSAPCIYVNGTGSALGTITGYSDSITVAPGRTYVFRGYINAQAVTAGTARFEITNAAGSTVYATFAATSGTHAYVSGTWTCPNGVTSVAINANASGVTATNGSPVTFSLPDFRPGSVVPSSYVPNYAAPKVYGLVASAVTTIEFSGDRYQDVKFSAIEPDWNAAIAEKVNQTINATRNNTLPPTQVDQYCVSSDINSGWSASGTTITLPAYMALFAAGTKSTQVASASVTVVDKVANWVWLNSGGGSYTVKQDPSPVTSAILVAQVMTNTTVAYWTYTIKAPIGALGGVNNSSFSVVVGTPTNYQVGASTFGVDIPLTVTYSAFKKNVAELLLLAVPHGVATNATWLYGASGAWGEGSVSYDQVPSSSGSVTVHMANMPTGVSVDIYAYLVGNDATWTAASSSAVVTLPAQTFNKSAMPTMPAGATVSLTGGAVSLYEIGMHTLSAGAAGSAGIGGWNLRVTGTLSDANSPASSSWGYQYILLTRTHTTSTPTDATTYDAHPQSLGQSFGNGVSVTMDAKVGAGQTIDIAFQIADGSGNKTPAVQISSGYTVAAPYSLPPSTPPIIGRGHIRRITDTIPGILDSTGSNVDYTMHAPAIQSVIDSSSNILSVEFSGGKIGTDGALTNVDGAQSATKYTLTTGSVLSAQADIAKGTSTSNSWLLIGNQTNGYGVQFYNGGVGVWRWASGVATNILQAAVAFTNDTNFHSFRISVSVTGSSNNYIEGSLDNNYFYGTDTGLNLVGTTQGVQFLTAGANGKVRNYTASATQHHYTHLPRPIRLRVGNDSTLDVSETNGPVSGDLPHKNHSSFVTNAIDTGTGTLKTATKNLLYNGGFAIPSTAGAYPGAATALGSNPPNPATDLVPGWQPFTNGYNAGDTYAVITGANDGGGQFDTEKGDPYSLQFNRTLTTASNWNGMAQRFSVFQNQWIAVRFWYYVNDLTRCHVKLAFYSSGTAAVGSGTASAAGSGVGLNNRVGGTGWSGNTYFFDSTVIDADYGGSASGWNLGYFVIQVPNNAVYCDFLQMAGWVPSSGTGSFYLDNIMIVNGQVPQIFSETVDAYNVTPPNLQSIVNSNGQGLQEDFYGVYESNPAVAASSSNYPGYKIVPGYASNFGNSWEKVGISLDVTSSPITFDIVGFGQSGGGTPSIGVSFLSDTTTSSQGAGVGDMANGYLAWWSNSIVYIYKRSAGGSYVQIGSTIGTQALSNGNDHHMRVVVQYYQSGILISVWADKSTVAAVAYDASPVRTYGYFGLRTYNSNFNMRSFECKQSAISASNATLAPPKKNLVVNGNNCSGAGTTSPQSYGWTQVLGNGSCVSAGNYGPYSAWNSIRVIGTSGGGVYQTFPVTPGKTYTVIAMAYADTSNIASIWIGNTAVNASWASSSTLPSGTPGTFYSYGSRYLPSINDGNNMCQGTTGSVAWECISATFTVPANTASNQGAIILRNMGTNASGYVYFNGVMVFEGSSCQDYIDHEVNAGGIDLTRHVVNNIPHLNLPAAYQNNWDSSGNLKGSGGLKTNLANSLAWTTDLKLHSYSSGASPNIAMKFYLDNGTANTNGTIWDPDGTTVTVPYTNTTTPWATLTGVTTNAAIYIYLYIDNSGVTHGGVSLSPYSQSSVNLPYADGTYRAINSTTSASPDFVGGGFNTSTIGGGGPAKGQSNL